MSIRESLKSDSASVGTSLSEQTLQKLRDIMTNSDSKMTDFAKDVMAYTLQLITSFTEEPPCSFAVIAMGSFGRGEAIPYSDLEYLFLIEEKSDDNISYFEKLAVTSYFVIGNLKETKLSHVAIEELQGWFEDMSRCGLQIDGLSMGAGNIPTGNGSREQKNQFIVTPEELEDCYRHVLYNPGEEALRGDLTSMLTYTKLFYSKQEKRTDLLGEFRERLAHITPNQTRKDINFKMLNTDLEKLKFMPWKDLIDRGHNSDAKKELYRFPSIILLDLTIILGNSSGTSWENIEQQSTQQAIPQQLSSYLKFALASAIYIRLSAYLHHNSQDNRISVAMHNNKSLSTTREGKRWFMPLGLFSALLAKLLPVQCPAKNIDDLDQLLREDVQWSRQLTLTSIKFVAEFFSHRYHAALSTLKTMLGNDLCEDPWSAVHRSGLSPAMIVLVADTMKACGVYLPAPTLFQYLNELPGSPGCEVNIAICLARMGRQEESINILLSLIIASNYPNSEYHTELAEIYQDMGNTVDAMKQYILALNIESNPVASRDRHIGTDPHGEVIRTVTFVNVDINDASVMERRDLLNASTPLGLHILYRLASCILEGNPPLAKAYSERIETLIKAVYGEEAVVTIAAGNQRLLASIHAKLKNFDVAIECQQKALDIEKKLAHHHDETFHVAVSHLELAFYYAQSCDEKSAKENYMQALDIKSSSEIWNMNTKRIHCFYEKMIKVLTALGAYHKEANKLEQAIDNFQQALGVLKLTLSFLCGHDEMQRRKLIADVFSVLGFLNLQKHETAEQYFHRALAWYTYLKDNDNMAKMLHQRGLNFGQEGKFYEAQECFERAIATYQSKYVDNEDNIADTDTFIDFAFVVHHSGVLYSVEGYRTMACMAYSQSIPLFQKIDPEHKKIEIMKAYLAIKPGPVPFE